MTSGAQQTPILRMCNVRKSFGRVAVLEGVGLEIR